jgi:hypothetical protein
MIGKRTSRDGGGGGGGDNGSEEDCSDGSSLYFDGSFDEGG